MAGPGWFGQGGRDGGRADRMTGARRSGGLVDRTRQQRGRDDGAGHRGEQQGPASASARAEVPASTRRCGGETRGGKPVRWRSDPIWSALGGGTLAWVAGAMWREERVGSVAGRRGCDRFV